LTSRTSTSQNEEADLAKVYLPLSLLTEILSRLISD
jgi:hypothetical protein